MAYFIAEFTLNGPKITSIHGENSEQLEKTLVWRAYIDGSSNYQGVGVGIILVSLEDIKAEKWFRLGFQASNNETEYEALLAWLRMARPTGADTLKVQCDSRLVVNQVNEEFEPKD